MSIMMMMMMNHGIVYLYKLIHFQCLFNKAKFICHKWILIFKNVLLHVYHIHSLPKELLQCSRTYLKLALSLKYKKRHRPDSNELLDFNLQKTCCCMSISLPKEVTAVGSKFLKLPLFPKYKTANVLDDDVAAFSIFRR
ncbi:hypothetical protein NQ317_012649 [Molorchus minor]|uniref:Uncharacterized protein n=1 Tax=Molorchus minor TaxID=1323400 RepID=A0ABQ9J1U1_9CUCU|nr:hypothetical protein NQ317_012649 [Molorchus minor]